MTPPATTCLTQPRDYRIYLAMKSDTYRKTELPVPGHTADNPPHQAGYFEMDPEIGISVFVSPPDAPINRMSIQEILRLEQDSLTPDP